MKTRRIVITKPGTKNLKVSFNKVGQEKELFVIIKGQTKGDYVLNVLVDHKVSHTLGRITVKGIAQNGARLAITGNIKIEKDVQGVDDFLEIRVLILDDKSQATALPQLEIEANNVKVSHAATIGQIDKEELFYLESRGLNRIKAVRLIKNGFIRL